MEENNPVQTTETSPKSTFPTNTPPIQAENKPKSSRKTLVILGIIAVLFIAGISGAYFFGKSSNKETVPTPTSSPAPTDQVGNPNLSPGEPKTNETATWKTYTGNGFSFKYPADWKEFVDESTETSSPQISIDLSPISTSAPGDIKFLYYKNQTLDKYLLSVCDSTCKTEEYSVNGIDAKKISSPPFPVNTELVIFNGLTGLFATSVEIPDEGPLAPFNVQNKQIYYQILSTFTFTE